MELQTGDILLVSGRGKLAKAIQKFQKKQDERAGKWNHSAMIYNAASGQYVCEASYLHDYRLKAGVVFNPIADYLEGDNDLMIMQPHETIPSISFEKKYFHYAGTPYEYKNLLIEQPIRILFNKWIGSKKHSDKRMVCHEFVMTVYWEITGMFPNYYKANIADIYHNPYFTKKQIK